MSDLIDRQAAIDAIETIGYDFSESELSQTELEEVYEAIGEVRQDFIRILRRLPPAQPELIHCKDCKYFEYNVAVKINDIPLIVAHEICTKWGDGCKSDENGNIKDAYSISAGLDYPGIGPEHAYLHEIGRVKYDTVTDKEAIDAFRLLTRLEGIIPAIESSHAVAYSLKIAKHYDKEDVIVICLSGRGDKDINTILNLSN